MPPDREEALRWVGYAEEDWQYGLTGLEGFPRPAAWSFHQSAEKYLKATLLAAGKEPPRTHDLLRLLATVEPGLGPDHELALAASGLAPFGAASRYPGDLPDLTMEDARRARESAATIRGFARARLGMD
ncbi:MAG: HEPN domain-containing protein [Actinomycetota bacterium]